MKFIVNTESSPIEHIDQHEADKKAREFLRCCYKLKLAGMNGVLIDESIGKFYRIPVTNEYPLSSWLERSNTDGALRDIARAIMSLEINTPLLDGLHDDPLMDVFYNNVSSKVLKAAALHAHPVVSFSDRHWSYDPIQCTKYTIHVDSESDEPIVIDNCHNEASTDRITSIIHDERVTALRSGVEIVSSMQLSYPGLILTKNAEDRLSEWGGGVSCLEKVKSSFDALKSFLDKWRDGTYSDYSHDNLISEGLQSRVSGESESCRSNKRRRQERTFSIPTGERLFFENHIKLTDGFRLYFMCRSMGDEKFIYIGYVGPHLS